MPGTATNMRLTRYAPPQATDTVPYVSDFSVKSVCGAECLADLPAVANTDARCHDLHAVRAFRRDRITKFRLNPSQ
ncbi:MAG: hypothetical protein AAGA71_10260 [Pseudomonadota bacterium]